MNVLAACRRKPVRKLVVSSTVLVYGPHPDNPNFIGEKRAPRGLHGCDFVADKLDVEAQVQRFAAESPACCVTVLRFATILGPTVDNYVARWLSRRLVPTVMGHDPLVQLAHEIDAAAALSSRSIRDAPVCSHREPWRGTRIDVGEARGSDRLAYSVRVYRQLAGCLGRQLSEAPPPS